MSFDRQTEKTPEDPGDPFHAVIRMGGFVSGILRSDKLPGRIRFFHGRCIFLSY